MENIPPVVKEGITTPKLKYGIDEGTLIGIDEFSFDDIAFDESTESFEFMVDWDDGTTSGWGPLLNSGQTASAKKTWTSQGTYQLRVVARDEHGKLSPWSEPLTVTMPRSKVIHNPFLNFLQNHPNLFPIIRQLLGL